MARIFGQHHYKKITKMLCEAMPDEKHEPSSYYGWRIICAKFADAFHIEDSSFDPNNFLARCGFKERKIK